MKKTTSFENIGWGKFAKAKITIEEFYTHSNDYDCTHISVATEELELYEITYEELKKIYCAKQNSNIDEWASFCQTIKTLPYFEELCL